MYRLIFALWACSCSTSEAPNASPAPSPAPAEPPKSDTACLLAFTQAPGPLADEASRETDPVALAEIRIREARLSSDDGFLTLADLALDCALARNPADPVARRYKGHVAIQFHRFAEAESLLDALVAETGHYRDLLLLGDAHMEQGELSLARERYDQALAKRPTLEGYDRLAHLSWLTGDLDAARSYARLAFDASTSADPEVAAWVAVAYGTYQMYAGEVPNEIGLALRLMPDYPHAHLALGRYFLWKGDTARAADHLRRAGPTVAAVRALSEIDPTASVPSVAQQDRRGYALWLAESDPKAALPLLDQELAERRDAITVIGRAWAAYRADQDRDLQPEIVRQALATGILDPSTLRRAAEVLADRALAARAASFPGGLLPSER